MRGLNYGYESGAQNLSRSDSPNHTVRYSPLTDAEYRHRSAPRASVFCHGPDVGADAKYNSVVRRALAPNVSAFQSTASRHPDKRCIPPSSSHNHLPAVGDRNPIGSRLRSTKEALLCTVDNDHEIYARRVEVRCVLSIASGRPRSASHASVPRMDAEC